MPLLFRYDVLTVDLHLLVHVTTNAYVKCTCACIVEENLALEFMSINLSPACLAPMNPPNRNPPKEAAKIALASSTSSLGGTSPGLQAQRVTS